METYLKNAPPDEIEAIYKSHREGILARIKHVEKVAKLTKRRVPKNVKTLEFLSGELDLYGSIYMKGSNARKLEEPEVQAVLAEKTKARLKNQSKEQLILECTSLEILLIQTFIHFNHCSTSYNRALDYLCDISVKTSGSATKRGSSRNLLHETDNLRLQECLSDLKNQLQRELKDSDLREYIRHVKRTYPEQSFIQKPRLTAEDKTLSEEDQAHILKGKIKKRGKSWSEPRIIAFFNSRTGLSGTTK